ncbi:MAG: YkgJ family cysteine cluster protein [Muribaculaceae bacterium]|nr:YkgJ family cysteine cluster protein [Muribaculaceae bacterium]
MMENYVKYLQFIDKKLTGFFEKQKPYIFCKRGCGKCCQNAQFPYTQIEAAYLIQGTKNLDKETSAKIVENINRIKQEKANFKGEKFTYDCPFLINNECSVYEYRGIVCRAFGLMLVTETQDGVDIPFCYAEGLNYSNVIEDDGSKVSAEKFRKLGIETQPIAFNASYKFLTDSVFESGFNFKFGDRKTLIDWL